ncbi:MAG TPA: SRPBCC family protein [Solirubrobacterales bacterium]|nr:SRPBCC family protein [Solirubrobacterales bacterium]
MTDEASTRNETTVTTRGEAEVRIERVFDFPRDLVWEAHTDPALLSQWLGPRRLTMTVEEMEVRPGGSYRYIHTADDGSGPFVFFGEFTEVEPPRLLAQTFQFEGNEHEPAVDRLELEELDGGRTRLVATSALPSPEAREAMLESGMETGVREGYEKLDELLARQHGESALG